MNNKIISLLHKTPFGYYVYDGNHNEIISVYKELYEMIDAYIKNTNINLNLYDKKVIEDFKCLIESGYLLKSNVKEINHPFSNMSEILLDKKVDQITLQLTQNCNLRCSYCIYSLDSNFGQRTHSKKHMTWSTAKKAIDFYHKHSSDTKTASINFYGGEPLLEFNLIKKCVEYSKKVFEGKKISFGLTTNATLFSNEIIDFLVKHNFIITISIDGPKEIQDKNRKFENGKGSFDIVYKNIHNLYKKYPEAFNRISISMVVDRESNYKDINKLFNYPEFKNMKLYYTPVEEDGILQEMSNEFLQDYLYDEFQGYYHYLRENDEKFPSKFVEQDFNLIKIKMMKFNRNTLNAISAPSGPCIPGKNRLFVSCDEELFPCERVNENDLMKIGTLDDGYNYNQINSIINISKLTAEKCKNCWAFQLCDICVKRADNNGKFSETKKNLICQSTKASALTVIRTKILFYEHQLHMNKMKKMINGRDII